MTHDLSCHRKFIWRKPLMISKYWPTQKRSESFHAIGRNCCWYKNNNILGASLVCRVKHQARSTDSGSAVLHYPLLLKCRFMFSSYWSRSNMHCLTDASFMHFRRRALMKTSGYGSFFKIHESAMFWKKSGWSVCSSDLINFNPTNSLLQNESLSTRSRKQSHISIGLHTLKRTIKTALSNCCLGDGIGFKSIPIMWNALEIPFEDVMAGDSK